MTDPPGIVRARILFGSHAYGTATETSDEDWRGVYQLPNDAFLGLFRPMETWDGAGDTVMWELGHFCRLLLAGNPNIVGMLWVEQSNIAASSPVWEALRHIRAQTLSTAMVRAYHGWVLSELKHGPEVLTPKRLSHLIRLTFELESAVLDEGLCIYQTGAERDMIMAAKRGETSYLQVKEWVSSRPIIRGNPDRFYMPDPPRAEVEHILLAARHGEYD